MVAPSPRANRDEGDERRRRVDLATAEVNPRHIATTQE
jgi:hypothetical protein